MIDEKHINKHSGYYQGPSGVFYDVKHDEIFVKETLKVMHALTKNSEENDEDDDTVV